MVWLVLFIVVSLMIGAMLGTYQLDVDGDDDEQKRGGAMGAGANGEFRVAMTLRNWLPDEYIILNNVYLPLPDGTTTQIDHIVVSQYGIFVVETKTYSGWIFGDENSRQWTHCLNKHTKYRFQNPLRQNYLHICALADNLKIEKLYFHSVVAFAGDGIFKTTMPPNVVHIERVSEYIRSVRKPLIKMKQLGEIASAITEWQETLSQEQIAEHVANLKRKHVPTP